MSELVPVSFYTDSDYMNKHYKELIDSGELLLEPGCAISDISVDKWVATKYFYKFFVKTQSVRQPKRLLKLFAVLGNICSETERERHYKITFKIITFNNNYTAKLDYDDMRQYGLVALDILNGKRVTDEAIYSLSSKFFYIFGLEGKYGQDSSQEVFKELLNVYIRKKDIRKAYRKRDSAVYESVLDDLEST